MVGGLITVIVAYCFVMYGITQRLRFRVFTGNHMKQFKDVHLKELKKERTGELGFPDTGSGRYSEKLSYKDWFEFNCGQRCQLNFLEQLPIIIVASLISGIKYRSLTGSLLVVYAVARLAYSIGYMKGPIWRVPGAVLQDIVVVALIGLAYKSCYDML